MYKFLFIIFFAGLIGGLTSCSKNIDPESNTAAATLDSNKADIMTYATTKVQSGTMTDSGLYYKINKPGSSTVTPTFGQELEFNYTLYFLIGPSNSTVASGVTDQLADSTYKTTSVFYPFFAGSLKSGLQEGFKLMHEGDQATLLIPSALAFGSVANPTPAIPANSPVRYDITLKRARTEDQQINEYIAQNKLTVTQTTSSGLRFVKTASVDTIANKLPTNGQTLTIRYTAQLLRSATAFANTETSVTLGQFSVVGVNIAGVNEGLAKLRQGEKATLIFPSSLGLKAAGAFSSDGKYVVPPNASLRYDVELVSVQ